MRKCFVSFIAVLFLSFAAAAEVPESIRYQGRLINGTQLVSGVVNLSFDFYTNAAPTAGETTFCSEQDAVAVVDGLYATDLGDNPTSGSLSNALAQGCVFLQIAVEGVPLEPREAIRSVAYARIADGVKAGGIRAGMMASNAVDANAIADGSIDSSKIAIGGVGASNLAPNAVTSGKIADGAISESNLGYLAAWKTAGNTGTVAGTHFLGTLDAQPLQLRANGARVLQLEYDGASTRILGGHPSNVAMGTGVTVVGGGTLTAPNRAMSDYGFIGGGFSNLIKEYSPNSFIGGGHDNYIFYNCADGTICGGVGNSINWNIAGAFVGGGCSNRAYGLQACVVGGENNEATHYYAFIGGGRKNQADSQRSVVCGGEYNYAHGTLAAILGGFSNSASGTYAFIGGGRQNRAGSDGSSIAGGRYNAISTLSYDGAIGGGQGNRMIDEGSVISGGRSNSVLSAFGSIGGGAWNEASGVGSVIGGGLSNRTIYSSYVVIGGGLGNVSDGPYSVIDGGQFNAIDNTGYNSVIGGGQQNHMAVDVQNSVIAGGMRNTISNGNGSVTIGGGQDNSVGSGANASVIAGGAGNTASGIYAAVSGGSMNQAGGYAASVPGGMQNEAGGSYSFAAGRSAKAKHDGSFVWADSGNAAFSSTTNDQFALRASNGVWMACNVPAAKRVSMGERYRDNGLVAWASVLANGDISEEFGVTRVTNTAAGIYSITIDARAASGTSLIPIANAEVDSAPAAAADLRIVSVNLMNYTNFVIYINNGVGSPVNNDFHFMVTGR